MASTHDGTDKDCTGAACSVVLKAYSSRNTVPDAPGVRTASTLATLGTLVKAKERKEPVVVAEGVLVCVDVMVTVGVCEEDDVCEAELVADGDCVPV